MFSTENKIRKIQMLFGWKRLTPILCSQNSQTEVSQPEVLNYCNLADSDCGKKDKPIYNSLSFSSLHMYISKWEAVTQTSLRYGKYLLQCKNTVP